MNAPEPGDSRSISYPVGPSQLRRIFGTMTMPPALGVASLAVSLASLVVVEAASELGDIHVIAHREPTTLAVYRWAAGLRMGLAAIAVVLAIVGLRFLLGRRPRLTIEPEDFEADDRSVDELESAVVAGVVPPPTWMMTVLGAALTVGLLALAINASVFGYAMASHVPPQNGFTTF